MIPAHQIDPLVMELLVLMPLALLCRMMIMSQRALRTGFLGEALEE
jgi:hypothetical protein